VSVEQLTVAELRTKAGQTIEITYSSGGQSSTTKITPVLQS
jgi:hypothetical protein